MGRYRGFTFKPPISESYVITTATIKNTIHLQRQTDQFGVIAQNCTRNAMICGVSGFVLSGEAVSNSKHQFLSGEKPKTNGIQESPTYIYICSMIYYDIL